MSLGGVCVRVSFGLTIICFDTADKVYFFFFIPHSLPPTVFVCCTFDLLLCPHDVLFSSLAVRWWARQIVKNIPPSDMLEVRAKVAALTALSGERKDWGIRRAWERDYLANVRMKHEQNANKVEPWYSEFQHVSAC